MIAAAATDIEKLEYVRAQVYALEEETARVFLVEREMPTDNLSVRRLVFARELFMTLQLREFVE